MHFSYEKKIFKQALLDITVDNAILQRIIAHEKLV